MLRRLPAPSHHTNFYSQLPTVFRLSLSIGSKFDMQFLNHDVQRRQVKVMLPCEGLISLANAIWVMMARCCAFDLSLLCFSYFP